MCISVQTADCGWFWMIQGLEGWGLGSRLIPQASEDPRGGWTH